METLNIEKFNPTKAEISVLVTRYKGLVIVGVEDKSGYEAVDEARKELKKVRVNIQKTGKSLREEAVAFQKVVIAKEKELVEMVEPTELELEEKLRIVDEEKEKIKRQKLLPERKEKLQSIGVVVEDDFLLILDENKFNEFFNQKNAEYLEEKEQLLKEEQEKVEIEKRKVQEEKEAQERESKRQADLEQAKKEAAERATLEAERKAKEEQERKEKEAEQKALGEKQEQEKLEKQKKYQDFLKKNGYSEETKSEFYIQREDSKIILYKKVAELTTKH